MASSLSKIIEKRRRVMANKKTMRLLCSGYVPGAIRRVYGIEPKWEADAELEFCSSFEARYPLLKHYSMRYVSSNEDRHEVELYVRLLNEHRAKLARAEKRNKGNLPAKANDNNSTNNNKKQ
jgi:hypothetical protein